LLLSDQIKLGFLAVVASLGPITSKTKHQHPMMTVWTLGGKIIRTVLCCVVYDNLCTVICAHVNR